MAQRVVVIGGGNAAFCAALSAAQAGAKVTLLERAPFDARGGNSRFTAGAIRTVYDGVSDLRRIMPDLTDAEIDRTDFGRYEAGDFYDDLGRVTQYRCDPVLADLLVLQSFNTLLWMHEQGVRFLPLYGRQSFEVDGKVRFWGGLTVEAWGGGPGLVDSLTDAAHRQGIDIHYSARALQLMQQHGRISGVRVQQGENSEAEVLAADAVVLASGGFQANQAWRASYLGRDWDLARVRGSRYNTGDGIRMALDIGARARGHWSGCHAVGWDMNAPEFGDLDVGDGFQKHSYPFGIMINANGVRFVDEGADFRNYTYARYGREILAQPGQFAWQIFDAKVSHLLRDEYRIRQVTKVEANSIDELAGKLDNVNPDGLRRTIAEFNAAVDDSTPFDPTIKDGRSTQGLQVPKRNWANRIDTPPFQAFGVTCGITFTFGGLHVDDQARVLDDSGTPIPELYGAGELVGGLFYHNYPGGSGLMAGAVFGREAGHNAAQPD